MTTIPVVPSLASISNWLLKARKYLLGAAPPVPLNRIEEFQDRPASLSPKISGCVSVEGAIVTGFLCFPSLSIAQRPVTPSLASISNQPE